MLSNFPTVGQYVALSSETLLVYDYLCTLENEITNVWICPFSLITLIFYVNRYLPFVDTTIFLSINMSTPGFRNCERLTHTYIWILVAGSILSHVIIMARTCALWGYRRWIMALVGSLALFEFSAALVTTHYQTASFKFVATPTGCAIQRSSNIIAVAYIMIFSMEATIVVLTLLVAYRHLPVSHSSWVRHLYRNGILFCVMMLAVSLVNVVLPLIASPNLKSIFATPQRILHSIICNRVLLLLFKHRRAMSERARISGNDRERQRTANMRQNTTGILTTTINTELFQLYYSDDIRMEIRTMEVAR